MQEVKSMTRLSMMSVFDFLSPCSLGGAVARATRIQELTASSPAQTINVPLNSLWHDV